MLIGDGLDRFLTAFGDARADEVLEELIFDLVRTERRIIEHVLAAAIRSGTAISGLKVQAPAENLATIQTDRGTSIVIRADYVKGLVFIMASSSDLAG